MPFEHLNKLAGPAFLMELCPVSFGLLLEAARLSQADAGVLLKRSPSLIAQLLAGETDFTDEITAAIESHFGIIALRQRQPSAMPLIELTPRGLKIARKGRKMKRTVLTTDSGLSVRYLAYLESGERGVPVQDRMRALSQALGVRFFTT